MMNQSDNLNPVIRRSLHSPTPYKPTRNEMTIPREEVVNQGQKDYSVFPSGIESMGINFLSKTDTVTQSTFADIG